MQFVDHWGQSWICCLKEEEKSPGPRGQLSNPGTSTVAPSSCGMRWTTTGNYQTNSWRGNHKPPTRTTSSLAASSSRSPTALPPPPPSLHQAAPT